jgi:hypothetical protein
VTARPVRCDTCAGPLAGPADAVVRVRLDSDEVVVGLMLVHVGHPARKGERTEDHPAAAFVGDGSPSVANLRDMARVPLGASVSRVLRLVARLAALDAQSSRADACRNLPPGSRSS